MEISGPPRFPSIASFSCIPKTPALTLSKAPKSNIKRLPVPSRAALRNRLLRTYFSKQFGYDLTANSYHAYTVRHSADV